MSKITLTNKPNKNKLKTMGKRPTKDPNSKDKRLVVDMPESLHKRIKVYCAENDKKINEYIIDLVKKDLDSKSK